MTRAGVPDASVFIADESGRALDGAAIRARRLATLDAVADMVALPIDEHAAREWARLRVHLAETGRRMGVNDLWIAALVGAPGFTVIRV